MDLLAKNIEDVGSVRDVSELQLKYSSALAVWIDLPAKVSPLLNNIFSILQSIEKIIFKLIQKPFEPTFSTIFTMTDFTEANRKYFE